MSLPLFHVGPQLPADAALPAFLLVPHNWDDYGYRTRFTLSVFIGQGVLPLVIGSVKILRSAYPERTNFSDSMRTEDFLRKTFEFLDPLEFCSLGQTSDYYTNLGSLASHGLAPTAGREIAVALNDVCLADNESGNQWFRRADGYTTSLLRFSSAYIANRDGATLLQGEKPLEHVVNSIPLGAIPAASFSPPGTDLRFDGSLRVPGRLNVIVGKNGSGKTHFLECLARWIGRPRETSDWDRFSPHFSRIVFVSTNTFDGGWSKPSVEFGQSVRRVGSPVFDWDRLAAIRSEAVKTPTEEWSDKITKIFPTPAALLATLPSAEDETAGTLTSLRANSDWKSLATRLFENPELGRLVLDEPSKALVQMSAGQRALTTLYSGIFHNLDKLGLVLLDEPENYLHPSLIARFIRNLNELLEVRSAFAVVATHSPIVVQETPRRFVWIVERTKEGSEFSQPNFETFGEAVENIDEYLFETDFRNSHWKRVLREFVREGRTNDDIRRLVGTMELSLFARAYLERERMKFESDADDAET